MMKTKKESAPTIDKHNRRRGRPAGKNRTPLSLEERRARNAQYERERRNETADAMANLAEAACCDPQIANAELLATVISQLQRKAKRKLPQDIDDLRRVNQNLEAQIAALQSRLGQDASSITEDLQSDSEEQSEATESDNLSDETEKQKESQSQTRRHKRESDSQTRKGKATRSRKIRKTSESSSVREKFSDSDSDTQSNSDTNSDWSETVKTQTKKYQLQKRIQKISEQSECSTSTYPYRTRSESSHQTLQSLKLHSDDSNQSDASEHQVNVPNENDPTLSAIPELEEFLGHFVDQPEETRLETLTEGEKRIINEWLEESEPLHVVPTHADNKVLNFLDFDDFMLSVSST